MLQFRTYNFIRLRADRLTIERGAQGYWFYLPYGERTYVLYVGK